MNFSIDEDLLLKCLKRKIRKDESEANVIIQNYEVRKYNTELGANYLSGLIKVRVQYEYNGKFFKHFFIIKVPSSGINYALGLKCGLYLTEKNMYEEILPLIIKKMKSNIVPEFYGSVNSEILILEDLTENGFQIKHNALFNFEKSKNTLKALAEFHAASYKLNQENPSLFSNYQQGNFINDLSIEFTKMNYKNVSFLLEKDGNSRNSIEKMRTLIDKITLQSIFTSCNQNKPWFKVLNHGDLNSNNILFKYNEKNEIIETKFIDFQGSFYNSPVVDIIWIFFRAADFNVFKNHFDELTDVYISKLNETLHDLCCQITYTKEQLNKDLKSMNLFRVFVFIWSYYIDMRKIGDIFELNKEQLINPKILDKMVNDERCKKLLSIFKYYDKIGVFDS